MRKVNNTTLYKLFIILLAATTFASYSYGHWTKVITVDGYVITGEWNGGIQERPELLLTKQIDGVYEGCGWTFPGDWPPDKVHPTEPWIRIGSRNTPLIPSIFKITLTLKNNYPETMYDIYVTDPFHHKFVPLYYEYDMAGTIYTHTIGPSVDTWDDSVTPELGDHEIISTIYKITGGGSKVYWKTEWYVDELAEGEEYTLVMWVATTSNGNFYHPTDYCGDELPINEGVTLKVTYDDVEYEETSEEICFKTKSDITLPTGYSKLVLCDGTAFTFPYPDPPEYLYIPLPTP